MAKEENDLKIEIRNLGYFGIGELKKLLNVKLNIGYSKIKAPTGRDYAYVFLRDENDRDKVIGILNGYKWRGRDLKACKVSSPVLQLKSKSVLKKNAPEVRTVEEAACPLAVLPYEQQLLKKMDRIAKTIEKFKNSFKKVNRSGSAYLKDFKCDHLIPSPKISAYRNKNEFTVGRNSANEVVVGFRLCKYSDGSSEVAEIQGLPHIPDSAKWAAMIFQKFMRESQYLAFDPNTNTGHVKQLMVRNTSRNNDIMIVVGVVTSNLGPDELAAFCKYITQFFQSVSTESYSCTSLYYQDVKHREVGEKFSQVFHLSGSTHISDVVHGLTFHISPLAFFQVNLFCTPVLFEEIIKLTQPNEKSIVFDICCGTGTIGLIFAKHCKHVYGVEINEDAVKDAKANAKNNNITNATFYAGNAEDYIHYVVKEAVYNNYLEKQIEIIAIVDPPRAGLRKVKVKLKVFAEKNKCPYISDSRAIASIRSCKEIKKLLYVSCDPDSSQKNWIDLGRPESKHYKGAPFLPTKSIAVDMFPHTNHVEMILVFERNSAE